MIRFDLNNARIMARAELPGAGITAILGPSGAGKSSLLRALAGLDAAQGHFEIGGERLEALPPHRRGIGVVFQDARLFPHLTVAGNIEYARRRARAGVDMPELAGQLGIAHLLARDTQSLSGGERQRVAIARALAARPRLLLMDEPVSALDLKSRAEILGLIEGLPRKAGIPILYVTHAIDEVARIADHLLLLKQGKLVASGDVHQLFADPMLDEFTGHFEAGALVEAVVLGEDRKFGLTRLACGGAELTVPVTGLARNSRVRLRIRARDVALALKKPSGLSIRNAIAAVVDRIEAEGAYAEVFLTADGQGLRARITRVSAHELKLKPGLKVVALIKTIAVDRQLF